MTTIGAIAVLSETKSLGIPQRFEILFSFFAGLEIWLLDDVRWGVSNLDTQDWRSEGLGSGKGGVRQGSGGGEGLVSQQLTKRGARSLNVVIGAFVLDSHVRVVRDH